MKSKTEIRRELKASLAEMTAEEQKAASARLCERLLSDPGILAAASLGIFLPLPNEPDLRPALQQLMQQGCRLALPFLEEKSAWHFHWISNLQGAPTGPWGLQMPDAGELVQAEELDAVLVPGYGFTREGQRIGRGKGIYDRLLEGCRTRSIGIAFHCQLRDDLPMEDHDIRLTEVWSG